ncbi:helix-turn-helix domain-containing protein [Planotetraspora phitsanulokensis]|uniref:Membrane protein n=1 Tax=Planotetraspora phitsanulokensis TaxID=575192 RepID=A0A8J3XGB1_9ACTN|nr:helix-turn-helix domain-containing protein [Planotetraspora phitsanulokensis]GII38886.1 membrane protein [Planotetraspora phitsanulokensis]
MSVGAALSEARQNAELTVSQLSDRTNIRETIIHGIERDDFSACGGDFYARGHIRAIAGYLGVEPDPIIREYDDVHADTRPPVRAATVFNVNNLFPGKHGRRMPNWTMAAAVALAIVVIFAIVRLLGGSDAKTTAAEAPVGASDAKVHHAKAPQVARDVVVVKASAVKPAWINVRDAKNHRIFQGTLEQGKTVTWTAKDKVKVVIGDAGAVRLEVNGKDLGTLGRDGQTVRRSFGLGIPSAR